MKEKPKNSNFSRFFREGTHKEKEEVFKEVIEKSTAEQIKILTNINYITRNEKY